MNMNDAIIEVLSHVAAHVWNKYTKNARKDDSPYFHPYSCSLGEVMKYSFCQKNNWGNWHLKSKYDGCTWFWNDELDDVNFNVKVQIGDDWKMEFDIRDVFDILNKFCKLEGKKLDMRFTSEHNTPSGITVDLDAIHNTCKWRLNGTLLTELDMGTINHADLAPMKSYKVSCRGKTYTMPYARALPRKVSGHGGIWFFFFPETSMDMSAKHDSYVA